MNAYYKGRPIFGPRGPAGPDGNPIGTVISYLGLVAPEDYLVCDGAVHNISDYPELAAFFREQFGSAGHFGGDGETTFAVPDMRNLFLRGYHGGAEEQLSREVGERQEGTEIPNLAPMTAGDYAQSIGQFSNTKQDILVKNEDAFINPVQRFARLFGNYPFEDISGWPAFDDKKPGMRYTARPVNMAVLFCIKAEESVPAENVYSTEETRIGTWIDGKPLYRRFFQGRTADTVANAEIGQVLSVETMASLLGVVKRNDGLYIQLNSGENAIAFNSDTGSIICYSYDNVYFNCPVFAFMEYTKTTD